MAFIVATNMRVGGAIRMSTNRVACVAVALAAAAIGEQKTSAYKYAN